MADDTKAVTGRAGDPKYQREISDEQKDKNAERVAGLATSAIGSAAGGAGAVGGAMSGGAGSVIGAVGRYVTNQAKNLAANEVARAAADNETVKAVKDNLEREGPNIKRMLIGDMPTPKRMKDGGMVVAPKHKVGKANF